jgi:hypothetical protein
MRFYDWLLHLKADGRLNHKTLQLHQIPEPYLQELWVEGVCPTVRAVINFCRMDPERFKDAMEKYELAA